MKIENKIVYIDNSAPLSTGIYSQTPIVKRQIVSNPTYAMPFFLCVHTYDKVTLIN